LLTLLVTLYDRYLPIHLVRFEFEKEPPTRRTTIC
jgi:hypothetical protein